MALDIWFLLLYAWFSLVLLGFTGFHWVLLGFTGFYWVLLGFIWFYRALVCSNRLYWFFTGFYWVSLGLLGLNDLFDDFIWSAKKFWFWTGHEGPGFSFSDKEKKFEPIDLKKRKKRKWEKNEPINFFKLFSVFLLAFEGGPTPRLVIHLMPGEWETP